MLKERVEAARAAARFALIQKRDAQGRPSVVLVPGHQAARYQVILRRKGNHGELMTVECRKEAGVAGYIPCQGNSNGTVCYHAMAAVIAAAEDSGYVVKFSDKPATAIKLKNFGGQAYVLRSEQGNGELYVTVYKGR